MPGKGLSAFLALCRHRLGDRPPVPRKSFKAHWDSRCEGEWRRAFYMFSLGKTSLSSLLLLTCPGTTSTGRVSCLYKPLAWEVRNSTGTGC